MWGVPFRQPWWFLFHRLGQVLHFFSNVPINPCATTNPSCADTARSHSYPTDASYSSSHSTHTYSSVPCRKCERNSWTFGR